MPDMIYTVGIPREFRGRQAVSKMAKHVGGISNIVNLAYLAHEGVEPSMEGLAALTTGRQKVHKAEPL